MTPCHAIIHSMLMLRRFSFAADARHSPSADITLAFDICFLSRCHIITPCFRFRHFIAFSH
jgi:hypothetical protein